MTGTYGNDKYQRRFASRTRPHPLASPPPPHTHMVGRGALSAEHAVNAAEAADKAFSGVWGGGGGCRLSLPDDRRGGRGMRGRGRGTRKRQSWAVPELFIFGQTKPGAVPWAGLWHGGSFLHSSAPRHRTWNYIYVIIVCKIAFQLRCCPHFTPG